MATSDIDELLKELRENEYWLRKLSTGDPSVHAERDLEKADKTARQIAAVEELRANQLIVKSCVRPEFTIERGYDGCNSAGH